MQSSAAGVLTSDDIHKIRHYVQHKYGDLPANRRAEIVADAMQRIVLRQLPDFPMEQKQRVMKSLLREVVANKGMPINGAQIFAACMKLDIEQPELLEPLHAWSEKVLGAAIDDTAFRDAVSEAVRIAHTPELGLNAWDAMIGTFGLQRDDIVQGDGHGLSPSAAPGLFGFRRIGRRAAIYCALFILLSMAMLGYGWRVLHPAPVVIEKPPVMLPVPVHVPSIVQRKNDLPDNLRYKEVDLKRLVSYLEAKSSLLAEEPYLSAIINAAKEHDIHPLLMFAITGQEQGFVPKTAKKAAQIANNPFNVFYSWQSFNSTIHDSAKIAGNTINRLSFERPSNVDAVKWINREYAEDEAWSDGVNSIFKAMIAQIMTATDK